jgi:hypothetical protein
LSNAINLIPKTMIMQNSISNQRCRLQRVRVASYISVSINPTLLKSMKNYHDTKHLNCCDWVLQNLSFVTNPTYTLINIQTNNIVVRTRPGYRTMLRGPTRLQHVSSKSISVEINHRLNFHNTLCIGRHFQKPNVQWRSQEKIFGWAAKKIITLIKCENYIVYNNWSCNKYKVDHSIWKIINLFA